MGRWEYLLIVGTAADVIINVIRYGERLEKSQSQYFTACFRDYNGRQRRITTKETNRKKAQMLADEYEKASRTRRSLKQAQAVLDRLHEELSGKRIGTGYLSHVS